MIEMSFFLGVATSVLWMSHLSDKIGRKLIVLICVVLNLLLQIVMMMSSDYRWLIVTIYILGALMVAN